MARLSGIKALYDPNNVFKFPQSIPVGSVDNATATAPPTGSRTSTPNPSGTGSSDVSSPNSSEKLGTSLPKVMVALLALLPFCLDTF
ncbi:hypothetical protein FRC16_011105 [Serendipita sp. 398]|nr:hypothetical protein FRC16_011105 [Serendipita sp. 398]